MKQLFFVYAMLITSTFTIFAQDVKIVALHEDPNRTMNASLFASADQETVKKYMPSGGAPASMSSFVLFAGEDTVLFDTGLGGKAWGKGLTELGVKSENVKLILITHFHSDHIGGLFQGEARRFLHAKVLCAEPERGPVTGRYPAGSTAGKIFAAYGEDFTTFQFGDEVFTNSLVKVKAIGASGHTPGHTAFLIEPQKEDSQQGKLLIVGDLLHATALQFPVPEACASFDIDRDEAVASRKRVLDLAAQEKWQIGGMHFPPPSTGTVIKEGSGYRFEFKKASERFEFEETHMGVPVRIIMYAPSSEVADKAAQEAFAAFHTLNGIMSDYDSESELMLLCANDGSDQVSDDLFAVLQAAKHYSTISEGAFDITVGPMTRLWRRSQRQHELPSEELVQRAKELVGNHLWELDEGNDEKTRSVRLLKPGMKLDLGAIAKGYAIDQAFEIIRMHGITSMLVDAGGDIRVGSPPPSAEGWKIAKSNETVFMKEAAMATSGGRFQYVEIDNVRYSHIVDSTTGLGMTSLSTVHVTAPTAMQADALATAISILGEEKGKTLIAEMKNVSLEFVEMEPL